MTDEHGACVLDMVIERFRCPTCRAELDSPTLSAVGDCSYEDVPELLREVATLAREWLQESEDVPRCASCTAPATLERIDYHCYHSATNRDLVVRCAPPGLILPGTAPELCWWDPTRGYVPVEELSDEEAASLNVDVLARGACASLEMSGVDEASDRIEALLAAAPTHPTLLELLPFLIEAGATGLAGAIVESRLEADEADADAHFWMSEIVTQLVVEGDWEADELATAEQHLQRALALRPSFPEAESARCNLFRYKGDDASAVEGLTQLVAKYPDLAAPHFNLGVMLLESAPERALAHFARGEELEPEDADYALGRARALIELERRSEAKEALARAELLDPEHPKLDEVRSALA